MNFVPVWRLPFLFACLSCCDAFLWTGATSGIADARKSRATMSAKEVGRDDFHVGEKLGRKKKRNKYKSFSKVKDETLDPMDALLVESEQKNRELESQIKSDLPSNKPSPPIDSLPDIEYPDTKHINPYDPSSFGYIEIGSVIGAHGVGGLVKVRCSTDFPEERLCTAGIRHLKPATKRAPRQIVLLSGRKRLDDEYLVKFVGVDDRDSANMLRGGIMYIREEQKVQTKAEEYLVSDLVGLDVLLADSNAFIGEIKGIVLAEDLCSVPGLGHDYLEIMLARGPGSMTSFRDELVLVPLVSQIVTKVDIQDNAITIDPPTGMLDLKYAREEKTRIRGFLPPAQNG